MHRLQNKSTKIPATKAKSRQTTKKNISTKPQRVKKVTAKPISIKRSTRLFSTTSEATEIISTPAPLESSRYEEEDLLAEAVIKLTPRDLVTAAHNGDIVLLKECLAQEDPKLDINEKNSYKQTPLILAIKQRHVKSVLLLAKHGADINLADGQQKMPPFLHVIKKNSVSLFNQFLALGPETSVVAPENKSPMTIAAASGTQINILNQLLNLGFSIEHRDTHGRTPLMYAVQGAKLREVEWWLNQGANPTTKDKHGKNAIDYAPRNHDGDVARLVRTRANEMNRIHKLETADENSAVKEALSRLKAQDREKNQINNPKVISVSK